MTHKTSKSKTVQHVAVAPLSSDLVITDNKVPTEVQLTPAGFFRAKDGRPVDLVDGWFIDESVAHRLIDDYWYSNARVIDYEHQTLRTEENGQPAPAAGWFNGLQWRESGLWATDVKWTPKAEEMILSGEYKYISPVILYDPKTGHVLDVVMAAITNNPAIDGMSSIANLTSQALSFKLQQQSKGQDMDLKKLIGLLGLPKDTSEEAAMTALKALVAKNSELAELKAQVEKPDPAKFVPIDVVKDLQREIAALSLKQTSQEVSKVVADAIEAGQLLPSQKEWATRLGQSDMAALTSFIEVAAPVAALTGEQSLAGSMPPAKQAALTAEEQQVAKAFGLSTKQFLAAKEREQGDNE